MNTQEGNLLLALFMGGRHSTKENHSSNKFIILIDEEGDEIPYFATARKNEPPHMFLRYNKDWNWLHKAWERFRDMDLENDRNVAKQHQRNKILVGLSIAHGTITEAFEALVAAVKWYNSQTIKTDNDGK